jgi:DNA polymerase III sliding clamp (beta) subunit (PCNA family)
LSADNFAFEIPSKRRKKLIVKDHKAFIEALTVCMLSVGRDTAITDQLGVTLIPDGENVLAFATDNATIAHAKIELAPESPPLRQRTILSEQFIKQILVLAKNEPDMHLEIGSDYAILDVSGVTVFGRLIVTNSPVDFVDIASRHFPKAVQKKAVLIPNKLKLGLILDRAVIITDSMTDQAATLISCDGDDKMKFVSKTSRGEIVDTLELPGHPQVTARLGSKVLRSGYAAFDSILVTEGCTMMVKGNSFYMVSSFSAD